MILRFFYTFCFFFFQAEDGIRDRSPSRGLGDVYKRQVQEEVGLKGARTSAYAISPDVALVTEVTPAGAHPGVSREQRHIAVGAGPTITVVDSNGRGVIVPKSVLSWLRSSAEDSSLDYQMD